MAGAKIALNVTPVVGEFNTDAAGNALTTLPSAVENAGYAATTFVSDTGDVTGTRKTLDPECSEDFRQRVGLDSILFQHSFEGTNIARDRIQQNDTTATAAQVNGTLTLNSGSSTASGVGCNIRTYRTFPIFGSFTSYPEIWAAITNNDATFAVTEFGYGYCSGVTAQLTDGEFFRMLPGGQLKAVLTNNSVDVSEAVISTTGLLARDKVSAFDVAQVNHYLIAVTNDEVTFWINDTIVAQLVPISTSGSPTSAMSQPLFARTYNSALSSAARAIALKFLTVSQGDLAANKPWSHQMCGSGGGAYQTQPGNVSGPTVTRGAGTLGWPTSATAKIAGTWTAATAPALNNLGGSWTSPAVSTLLSEVDYPVFSYLNPAGSATLPGKTLYITGLKWGKTVATAPASTNNILFSLIAAVGSTVSATTVAESATAVAARGIVLDTIPFKLGAVVGDYVEGHYIDFGNAPLVVYPGHYFHFVVRPAGTVASNTLTVTGSLAVVGYTE